MVGSIARCLGRTLCVHLVVAMLALPSTRAVELSQACSRTLLASMPKLDRGCAFMNIFRPPTMEFGGLARASNNHHDNTCGARLANLKECPLVDTGIGAGGSGNSGNGRGWFFGRWGSDGQRGDNGGFNDGKFAIVAAALASDGIPRVVNRTILESETGIKFPPLIKLNNGDKSGLRFVGAGCRSVRPWRNLFRKVREYAVGLYVDADLAAAKFGRAGGTPADAQAALQRAAFPKTLRLVLAQETDTWRLTADINDRIEAKLAQRSYVDLAWLELWRNWMVDQGGYRQRLPKGIEIRFTQLPEDPAGRTMFVTEIRKRDRVLATKELDSKDLGWAIFEAYIGSNPLAPGAKADMLDGFRALCARAGRAK